MRKFSRFFVSIVIAGLVTACASTPAVEPSGASSYGDKVGGKAANAAANLTSGFLEIPKNIINTTNRTNVFYGIFGGLAKGMINTAGRIGVGVTDLITLPIPTKPIAQPAYIWDNFDVDTSYGPVFRLDDSHSALHHGVTAPVSAAPATMEAKPQPIDASKQLHEETNHKLDTYFKREMSK